MLVGSREFIDRARIYRKLYGGGMRQVGVLAAAALVALEKSPARLHEDHANARYLAEALSRWYFSANGGMFLTARARDFYFALQESLEAAADLKGWKCTQRPEDVKKLFRDFLKSSIAGTHYAAFDPEVLEHPESIDHKQWLQLCRIVAEKLRLRSKANDSAEDDQVFAVVQQVSSALRSILADELHTRLDLNIPHL